MVRPLCSVLICSSLAPALAGDIPKFSLFNQVIENIGAPGRTRIPNLLIRSQTLYPIELRALGVPCQGAPAGAEATQCGLISQGAISVELANFENWEMRLVG